MYDNLKKLRERLGLTQAEFGKSVGVAKTTYNNYETGAREPKSDFWISVAEKYNVTIDYLMGYSENPHMTSDKEKSAPSLSEEAQKLAKGYDELDDHGKTVVDMLITEETARMKRDSLTTVETEELWQYDEPVSAGDGTILGYMSGHKVVKTVSNTYTRKADFIVSVRGSSMEPRFYDNDLILVQETDDIEYGEVGIWYLDGRSYVKQKGHGRLISLNEMYRDVYMEEFSECRCQGRVIGTLDPDWIVEE